VVIGDPSSELVGLVTAMGDPAPAVASAGAQQQAELIRRRFGLSLPPPFVAPGPDEPVRPATAPDGAAIAAVKWRVMGTSYRGGVLDEAFLDGRDVVPPPLFWTGRAMVPPSRRHRLLVLGGLGRVFGYVDTGPAHPPESDETLDHGRGDDAEQQAAADRAGEHATTGEVYELYVDPSVQGRGGGTRLLDAAVAGLTEAGFDRIELSVLVTNPRAQAFYRARGWAPTGVVTHVDLGVVAFDEARFAFRG
jgi:ribosomal protein S18 acetylase RimI-like enzyme